MITYNTKLLGSQEDLSSLKQLLEFERTVFNFASEIQFKLKKKSLVVLHKETYFPVQKLYPNIPSQVIIRGEHACLAAYRSVKSNKHKISSPVEKKRLSIHLDKRLYSLKNCKENEIRITTANKRKTFSLYVYPKLQSLLNKFTYKDPLLYVENGQIYICLTFETKTQKSKKPKLALGVDVGARVSAALSDGRLIIDKKFNKEKRQLRYLKRKLQSCGTSSAKRHLKKLRRKERNKNKNQSHLIANTILKAKADCFVFEKLNVVSLKSKKHKNHNRNYISQVPISELIRIVTYKAKNMGKHVLLVSPRYTSQTDSLTGKQIGKRLGRRFYAKSGLVYDSDINAARNIGNRSKLPVSYGNLLDGQGVVSPPIVTL